MLTLKPKYFLFLIVLVSISITRLTAKHIVGGVMSYQCLGNGNYKIKLKVYRDCASNGAQFDDPALIGVYKCGVNINCAALTQSKAYAKPTPKHNDAVSISPPVYPCLKVPPTVCVEEAIYEFNLNLPLSTESYFIVYQRCCRNNTISNIVDPSNTGATFMIEITPESQNLCNNSPEFSFFPPTLICANEILKFDHSAKDKEGDQLVYSLCAPLIGGGPVGVNGGGGGACDGIFPNPACPPPFDEVQYILPAYSFDKPLGKNSTITIDPFTGELIVKPGTVGQFVVGVCVSEFRNGILLSTVRRDFQFNVADCEPNVVAEIKNDKVLGNKQFLVNSCGQNSVTFINKSHPTADIFKYDWHFDDGIPQDYTSANATVSFPDTGTYKGTMILNGGSICADTATIYVNIFPSLNADFIYDYDTCKAQPVVFTDKSVAEAGKVLSWKWNFGDGKGNSILQDPQYKYTKPGLFPAKLSIADINNCKDSIVKNISYFPVPPLIIIQPSSFLGCVPSTIKFTNLSSPIDTSYDIIWDFGDGSSVNEISPTHVYEKDGVYSLTINVTSPIGCKTSASFNSYITIEPSPVADFIYTPESPSNLNPEIQFQDQSQGAVSWGWSFGDGGHSIQQNPLHTYVDTGLFVITQYVKHKSGCIDTLSKIIDIKPVVTYFLPNAFTPNGDGTNDEFKGKGIFLGLEDFEMIIWNRWGEKIFTSHDPNKGWDGRVNNEGNYVQSGVYVCTVKFKGPRNKNFELKGFATVVR